MRALRLTVFAQTLLASGCCCSGLLFDDASLESAERDLPNIEAGETTFAVRATLDGRYVREHHGGGPLGYDSPTSEQRWTLRVQITRADEGPYQLLVATPRTAEGWVVWTGEDRDDGEAQLDALSVEHCSLGDRGEVLRVPLEGQPWLVARGGEGWAFVAPFESDASTCEQARGDAPEALAHLQTIWEDGIRARLELTEQRRTRPGSGISPEGHDRTNAAVRACGVLLDRHEAEQALRCLWASRVYPSSSHGAIPGRAATYVSEGADAEVDLEAAMFTMLAPGAWVPHPNAEYEAVILDHGAAVVPEYVNAARTPERVDAFLESSAALCAETECEPWRVRSVEWIEGRREGSQ